MKLYFSLFLFIVCVFSSISSLAQGGYHFGLKLGPTLATQSWNFGDRRIQPTYHGSLFIESRDPADRGSLYAQLGLHNRGSSLTINNFAGFGSLRSGYNFQNLSLILAAKKNVASSMNFQPYYLVGIRVEYNLSDNLEELTIQNCFSNTALFTCPYPDPSNINHITYGISIGGGIELSKSDFFTSALELTFSPDLSYQLQRARIDNITTPQPGNTSLGELQIRNISLEISLVFKFLREIIYE